MTPEQISESDGPAERRLAGVALNPALPVATMYALIAAVPGQEAGAGC